MSRRGGRCNTASSRGWKASADATTTAFPKESAQAPRSSSDS
eukprot:CAMPEP_0197642748 /NCGR_PEP_ID=MMETSP1338-20131121/16320_1 /TAXON_ID=43686 ORGANISM="Pelagodinium beii, Strain RCC1491" /NCGR_SAMPLE_ID=MMETSP1338 /ASSEMBLY_ACC=CAM_ASM_000754 /LENGTH=41 /DNA_ID= /DNA_START= /DNA_END= /DNA_ORIENTATION=